MASWLHPRSSFYFGAVETRRPARLLAHASGVMVGESGAFPQRPPLQVQTHHRGRECVPRANRIDNVSWNAGFVKLFTRKGRITVFVAFFPLPVNVASMLALRHDRGARSERPHHRFHEVFDCIATEETTEDRELVSVDLAPIADLQSPLQMLRIEIVAAQVHIKDDARW